MVPEEDPDEAEPSEKQPLDLEEMLELFRDDEEPKRKSFNPMWAVLAIILVAVGSWLAVAGTEGLVAAMGGLKAKIPLTAKTSERLPEAAVDVAMDYQERCRKGMTKDQIRWIVGDFQKARLDEGPGGLTREIQSIFDPSGGSEVWNARDDEDSLPIGPDQVADLKSKGLLLAKAQQDWYVDALADGLHLDAGQIARARDSGREFIDEKGVDFLKYSDALHSNGPDSGGVVRQGIRGRFEGIRYVFPESGLLVPDYWMVDPANAPWKRCELRPEQLAISANELVAEGVTLLQPYFVEEPARILLFTEEQMEQLEGSEGDLLATLSKLHPAQFKLALLCHPDWVGELMPLLEKE